MMGLRLILLSSLVATSLSLVQTLNPNMDGSTPKFHNNRIYYFFNTLVTWHEALHDCKKRGSTLISIITKEDLKFFKEVAIQEYDAYWVSGNRVDKSEDFVWINGKPVEKFVFQVNEPNNMNNHEHCLEIDGNGVKDYTCFARFAYMCQDSTDDDAATSNRAMTFSHNFILYLILIIISITFPGFLTT